MNSTISVTNNPEMFYKSGRWMVPTKDDGTYKTGTYKGAVYESRFLKNSYAYCTGFRTVIQAGGNVGVFPVKLSPVFERVITVEPDAWNYSALLANISACPNVTPLWAALGHETTTGSVLEGTPGNTASYQVVEGNEFPVIRVDDLNISDCDLLLLDVEGYEIFGLLGATKTIERSSPVICVEIKQSCLNRYNLSTEDVFAVLREFGYAHRETIAHRDFIFTKERT